MAERSPPPNSGMNTGCLLESLPLARHHRGARASLCWDDAFRRRSVASQSLWGYILSGWAPMRCYVRLQHVLGRQSWEVCMPTWMQMPSKAQHHLSQPWYQVKVLSLAGPW